MTDSENQRIAALEARIASLEARIVALEMVGRSYGPVYPYMPSPVPWLINPSFTCGSDAGGK